MEQLGIELSPIWDAYVAGGDLTHCDKGLTPHLKILRNILPRFLKNSLKKRPNNNLKNDPFPSNR